MVRNVIIVGAGRVGRRVAEQLSEVQNTVTIVELDPEKCEQVSPKVSQVIEGDGTDPDILEQTDLATADVFAALTNDTRVNISAAEMVHEMAPNVRTILRISRDGEEDYGHRRFVDSIVYPAAAGATVAVDQITRD
ncbi:MULTISPECIES: potassium channel family protein [Haloarcula]|uniref:potassium channel family protein n=1 Tax=Haloarcula TaxID=2237 RepID=UPI0023EAE4B4|nr:NAD(P)-binding protein [Halomicroarcula sp. XH51]